MADSTSVGEQTSPALFPCRLAVKRKEGRVGIGQGSGIVHLDSKCVSSRLECPWADFRLPYHVTCLLWKWSGQVTSRGAIASNCLCEDLLKGKTARRLAGRLDTYFARIFSSETDNHSTMSCRRVSRVHRHFIGYRHTGDESCTTS